MDSVKTGAHTHLSYLHEDNGFANDPADTDYKPFGYDAVVTDFTGDNNPQDLFEPNRRNVSKMIAQGFEGSVTIEGTLTNPWWLRQAITEATTTGTAAPYTHTFDGQWPDSMQITVGFEPESGGHILRGVGVETASLSVESNGLVTFSLDCLYAEEEEITSIPTQPPLNLEPFAAQHAHLELDGIVLELIDGADVEISNTLELVHEIGSRNAVGMSVRERVPTLNFNQYRLNADNRKRMYGSETATSVQTSVDNNYDMTLVADDGAENVLQVGISNALPESVSTENVGDPQEDIMESADWRAADVTATAENSVSGAR